MDDTNVEGDQTGQELAGEAITEDGLEPLQVTAQSNPLTQEMISSAISLIGRTVEGNSHAYIRLELHQKEITNLSNLDKFPHLRYIVAND